MHKLDYRIALALLALMVLAPQNAWADGDNDNCGTTVFNQLGHPETFYEEKIDDSGDVDWYRGDFGYSGTLPVHVIVVPPNNRDYDIKIYDSCTGNPVKTCQALRGVTEDCTTTVSASYFYVKVYGWNNDYDSSAPYEITAGKTQACSISSSDGHATKSSFSANEPLTSAGFTYYNQNSFTILYYLFTDLFRPSGQILGHYLFPASYYLNANQNRAFDTGWSYSPGWPETGNYVHKTFILSFCRQGNNPTDVSSKNSFSTNPNPYVRCTNQCTNGAQRCSNMFNLETCGDYGNGCYQWGGGQNCNPGTYCSGSQCANCKQNGNSCSNPGTSTPECCTGACNYNSECGYPACSSNTDCGTDGFVSNNFCSTGDVYRTYRTYTCNSAGHWNAFCSQGDEQRLIENCSYWQTCSNGACQNQCSNECSDHDEYTCSAGDVYACKTNFDQDPCYEQGLVKDCNLNQACRIAPDRRSGWCENNPSRPGFFVDYAGTGVTIFKQPADLLALKITSQTQQTITFSFDANAFEVTSGNCVNGQLTLNAGETNCRFTVKPDAQETVYHFDATGAFGTVSSQQVQITRSPKAIILTNRNQLLDRYAFDYGGVQSVLEAAYQKAQEKNTVVYDLNDYLAGNPFTIFSQYYSDPLDPSIPDNNAYSLSVSNFIKQKCLASSCKSVVLLGDDFVIPHYRVDYRALSGQWFWQQPETNYIYSDNAFIPKVEKPFKDLPDLFKPANRIQFVTPDSPTQEMQNRISEFKTTLTTKFPGVIIESDLHSGDITCDTVLLRGKTLVLIGDRQNNNAIKCIPWFGAIADTISIERNVWGDGFLGEKEYALILSGNNPHALRGLNLFVQKDMFRGTQVSQMVMLETALDSCSLAGVLPVFDTAGDVCSIANDCGHFAATLWNERYADFGRGAWCVLDTAFAFVPFVGVGWVKVGDRITDLNEAKGILRGDTTLEPLYTSFKRFGSKQSQIFELTKKALGKKVINQDPKIAEELGNFLAKADDVITQDVIYSGANHRVTRFGKSFDANQEGAIVTASGELLAGNKKTRGIITLKQGNSAWGLDHIKADRIAHIRNAFPELALDTDDKVLDFIMEAVEKKNPVLGEVLYKPEGVDRTLKVIIGNDPDKLGSIITAYPA